MYQLYSTHKASHKCLKRKKEIAESSIAVGEEGQSLQEKKKRGRGGKMALTAAVPYHAEWTEAQCLGPVFSY